MPKEVLKLQQVQFVNAAEPIQLAQLKDGLEKPQFTPNALEILAKRYLNKDEDKQNETPVDLLVRVAEFIAKVETQYGKTPKEVLNLAQRFYEIMARLEFFPNSPTLRGAGTR